MNENGVHYLGAPVTADVPWIIDDGRQTKDLYIKNKFIKINIHQKDFTQEKMEGNLKCSLTVRGRATAVTKPVQIIGTNDAIF
jgi:hypothetical protein